MAIFQYQIEAVPREFAKANEHNMPQALEESLAWENYENPTSEFILELRKLLPVNNSWGETEEYKSDTEWESQLQIFKTGDKIESILLKYAPCSDKIELLKNFVDLAANEKCVLYAIESKTVYEPNINEILEDLKTSKAVKFMENPENTIIESANEIEANRVTGGL